MKIPHDYQNRANEALWDEIVRPGIKPVVVAPVGSGKSFMLARFCKEAIQKYPETKILILCHVSEILSQISEELLEMWPDVNKSFYSDKLGEKNLHGQIILGGIQSIFKKGYEIPGGIDIVITDECHLISPNDETMYRKLFADLETLNPNMKIVGFTGTNFRPNSGILTEGEDRLFNKVAYQIPMIELINKGFLCPLVTPQEPIKTKMSVEGVSTRNGDFVEKQLQKAVDQDHITKACVDEIVEHGKERKKWIVFTAGVEHCEHVRDEIRSRGIKCEMVTGKTPTGERAKIFHDYRYGDLQCLVNVGVATTGYNNPAIDMLVFMRPTKSPVLYVQMAGRALRVFPGKIDSLVLDFGGVIDRLGPVDTVDARILNKKKGDGDAPIKVCPKCKAVCFAGVRECQDCGFLFPFTDEIKLDKSASAAPILSTQQKPIWHKVISTQYTRHTGKNGKPDTFRAKYVTFSGDYNEFLAFESFGPRREAACFWHRKRFPAIPAPNTIDGALMMRYPGAEEVLIQMNGKYGNVIDVKIAKDGLAEILPPIEEEQPSNNILAEVEDIF